MAHATSPHWDIESPTAATALMRVTAAQPAIELRAGREVVSFWKRRTRCVFGRDLFLEETCFWRRCSWFLDEMFLDEIGELPCELQPKLLRALQEREVRPVGDDRTVSFNARVITATNRILEDEIEDGRFREDLFYRINVVRIELPPLRQRGNDVLLLAQKFLGVFADRYNKDVHGLTPEAGQALLEYAWPGNVRELENSIDRAVALTKFDRLTRDDLPARVRERRERLAGSFDDELDDIPTLAELEERYIRQVLAAVDDNKSHAARILGINRKTLHRRAKRNSEAAERRVSGSEDSG